MSRRLSNALLLATMLLLAGRSLPAFAACGGTSATWNGSSSTTWGTAANWTPSGAPNSATQDVTIPSATRNPTLASATVGCFEVTTGVLNASANGTNVTINGDYFRALTASSFVVTSGRTVTLLLAGSSNQTLEVVDPINYVTISNNQTVSFTQATTIRNTLSITGSTTTLNVNANLTLSGAFTIPAGTTVNVASGATLKVSGGLTVNGTLNVAAGGKVQLATATTLSVASGATLALNGSSGNLATIDSISGTYTFSMAGTLSANYFYISHMDASGLNVTGTVSQLQNGEFHYIASAGVTVTVGATASLPANMGSVSFYDDSGFSNNFNFSVNASYAGNTVFLDNYAGEVVGTSFEQSDTNNKITWGSAVPSPFVACGTTVRTWNGNTSSTWAAAANWTAANVPNTPGEDALIVSATRVPALTTMTVGCMEIQSGSLTASANSTTLTVAGSYLKALSSGSFSITSGRTVTVDMAGAVDQTLEVVDNMNYVNISNSHTVTFTRPFTIRNTLSFSGSGTVLNINGNLTLTGALTIPAGVTVNVGSGVTLTASSGITVNGTLTVAGGGKVLVGSGKTLSVASGGSIQLNGSSGNTATLDSVSGTYTFTMAGTLSANYFTISHTAATGVNVTGTVSQLQNGDFRYVASAGVAITVGASAALPTTMASVGFYDDSAFANNFNFSVNASYAGNTVYLDQYAGGLGGSAKEKTDTNNKITWGSAASTVLTLADNTASGSPPSTIAASSAATLFGTYSFNLSSVGTSTDVTQIKFTMYGTANASDINYIQVFKDASTSKNCAYNSGVDTQVGSNLTLSGSPPTATATFSAGDVTTTGAAQACVHVLVATSSTAQSGNTIGISIESNSDVTNSKSGGGSYSFGVSSSPPVRPGTATISGTVSRWDGSSSTAWATAANWTPATLPSSTQDCIVGSGVRVPSLIASVPCRNTTFQTGGTIDFASGAWQVQSYGALAIQSGFTFQNASSGTLAMVGSTTQSISTGGTTFPGALLISNTGGADVTVNASPTFTGDLTITQGNLRITSGNTLTIGGNVTIQSGGSLTIDPGGTLALGDGKTLTVNSGGTLSLLGNVSNTALVTLSSGSSGYSIVVDGTISAQYYTIDHMGLGGLTIDSGASIDASHYLQNGSFTYPVVNNAVMLTLNRQIPGNALGTMVFDANGSAATGVTSVLTNASSGTLTITTYSGSWSGPSYSNASTYLIAWTGATNTIDITQEATGPSTVNQGTTYTMGRFGFKQTQAGASYVDAHVTSLTLTLTGTGSSSDISAVRIYYDSSCAGTGGTQLGSAQTFSGNPATATFSGISATVNASTTTPPKRCIYVQYDIAANAVNSKTVGVKLNANGDLVNDQSYAVAAGTPLPISLGSAASIVGSSTSWTGATSTDFCTSTNWSGGLPSSTLNCTISSATNLPVINGSTCTVGTCKSVTINSGTLTVSSGGTLKIYGSLTNSATFSNSGTLELDDGGVAVNQTVSGVSSLGTVTFAKTGGGTARSSGTSTITTLTIPSGSNFEWDVQSGDTLTLTNGLSIGTANAIFNLQGGGTLKIPSGNSISLTAGTFKVSGTNDAYPQTTTNKGKITNNGSGTWSFSSTGGTVDLTGWWFNAIDSNGLVIGGNTTLSHLDGGQFTSLPGTYPMKAIQLNTTGTIPATASNVGWNWGSSANGTYVNPPSPLTTDNYYLAASTGCGGQSISFDQWFGDFFVNVGIPDTTTKISASSCSITIAASASPVTLLSFTATAYDSAVSLDWQTGSELDHAGFNVYRSLNPDAGYVQVNPSLIRNIKTSASLHGTYRYVDADVANGLQYFYRIEDVATNGARQMHGPVWATPDGTLGTVPGTPASTNGGTSGTGGDAGNGVVSGSIAAPDVVDLGNGVHVLAQTHGSLRVEIVPPAMSFAPSSWNGAYERISLAGYSATTTAGSPELMERTILVEVDEGRTTASITQAAVQEASVASHSIEPAPSYILNGSGVLVPSYAIDSTAYSINAYGPASFYSVDPNLKKIAGKTFVSIHVTPAIYNPVSQQLRSAQRIVLDIGLDGGAWTMPSPAPILAISPSAVEGTLRIRYAQTGMYELAYDDIVQAGLDGFFQGAPVAALRLYVRGQETPLEVQASGSGFASGDRLRFFLPFVASVDDVENEAVLAVEPLAGSASAPLRMQHLDGNPSGAPLSDEQGSFEQATAEQDLFYVQDVPLGVDGADHFYWTRVTQDQGVATQASATFDIPVSLPNLRQDATDPVIVRLSGRGRGAMAVNPVHHVGILVNSVPFLVGDKTIATQMPTTVSFAVPAQYFAPGTNSIKIRVLGDRIAAGDTDIFDIDKIQVDYRADRIAAGDALQFYSYRPGSALAIDGFSTGTIAIYDVTEPNDVLIVDNSQLSVNGGTFGASMAANSGPNEDRGFRYFAVGSGGYLKPTALRLGRGADLALKSSANGADLLIVGPRSLIDAAQDLIDRRRAEGLRVVTAPLDQVYAEFSNGTKSSQAIRDLVQFAQAGWVAPAPRYLLLLGDATYDPRNRLGYGASPESMPVYLETGIYADFAADNWFVAKPEGGGVPAIAVGRIPSDDPGQVRGFVTKLLDYESGARAPSAAGAGRVSLIADRSMNNEGFSGIASAMSSAVRSFKKTETVGTIDRSLLGSDSATQAAILDQFGSGPFGIAYIGHGAENMWAGPNVFTVDQAEALTNTRLPFVLAMNCLNAYFYDADPTYRGLGEALVLNPSGGAVAFWGSTTMTTPAVQYKLVLDFFAQFAQEANQTSHDVRYGDLILRAKEAMGSSAANVDALRSYTLIGDPSTRLPAGVFTQTASSAGTDTKTGTTGTGGGGGDTSEKKKGGFLGCGTLRDRGDSDGGDSDGGAAAMTEFALLVAFVLGVRRWLRQDDRSVATAT